MFIIELNVKGKIIKCLGGNREYLYDLKRQRFLKHYKKKILIINFKMDKLDYIKIEKCYLLESII